MPKKRKRRLRKEIRIGLKAFCLVLAAVVLYRFVFIPLTSKTKQEDVQKNQENLEIEQVQETGQGHISFVGVGDNLIHAPIYEMASQPYNFDEMYALTNSYTQNADLSFVNLETLLLGDAYGLSGYPMFNGPSEILPSLMKGGYNWVALSSNHSLDCGIQGLLEQRQILADQYPDVSVTGSHLSDNDGYVVREINGVKVGLLGYTYGLNGLSVDPGYDWAIDLIDVDQIYADMEALSQISDIQIVSMHWGTEYLNTPDENQEYLTQILNEAGAEVIIGTHPHVLEPVEIYEGENQQTLVYYSLGNFLSRQQEPERMVGGMARFEMDYDFDSGTCSFSNIELIPTVTYISSDMATYRTTTLHEYTEDMAADHWLTAQFGYDMSKEWIMDYVKSVVPENEQIHLVLD
jgi:poly-gamma-glutamate synthesis protein (capsule biosynthesis protein)